MLTNENLMSVKRWGNEEDQEAINSSYVPIPKMPLILGYIIVLEKILTGSPIALPVRCVQTLAN